tara:strand:- start:570 stop:812 length:243 start_codon:yes stop_codon:yes gene_type:complete
MSDKEKLSIKMQEIPRIFRDDLDSQLEKDVFDEILKRDSEQRKLNLSLIQTNILIKGLSDTLIGLMHKTVETPEVEPTTE